MPTEFIIAALVALVLGLTLGWLIWARAATALRAQLATATEERDEARAAREQLDGEMHLARSDRALAEQNAAGLKSRLEEQAPEIERLRGVEVAFERLKAAHDQREEAFREREADLDKRFQVLADAALGKTTEAFLKRADETLKLHRETVANDSGKNREALDKLISPMRETLTKYETQLKEIEEKRAGAYGAITNAIADVKLGQERVSQEAQRIVGALRNAPKARGRWGEHQLRRVLEMAGLSKHCDFAEEVHVGTDDGPNIRPDAVINLPNNRVLVIDAKVSLNAYQDAASAETDEERQIHLLAHAKAMKAHVDTLGRKSYTQQFDETLDFVIMFVPGENFLAAALETDQDLFETAFERKVLLASPTNLIAIAKTVAMVWQQENAAADAREIAALGKELYDRLATMGEHVSRVGRNLDLASGAYNKLVGSLESQVMTSAHRLREKAIDAPRKTVEALPSATVETRPLTKLDAGEAKAD
ncbi:DNA recombination protein RmuC [Pacificimonas sp. WHA3]|uniref:DNA recombination protein RmuC homolog n=1 Tax=Pacificimonas pallii TaxID=2827236 RepID=A0ABS6SGB6_9SPHN|nr:DNA recombination protein RmuC [Pacificimonas pallii]MBV7257440.1 DNA recombination protein RmuC [Pacificimonas pallii]